jgi:hypothetical protein
MLYTHTVKKPNGNFKSSEHSSHPLVKSLISREKNFFGCHGFLHVHSEQYVLFQDQNISTLSMGFFKEKKSRRKIALHKTEKNI